MKPSRRASRARRRSTASVSHGGAPASALTRHWGAALFILFIAALAWRLAYLHRLLASPLADSLRGDERSYWDWATFLLANGFRGANAFFQGPLYPYWLAIARGLAGSNVATILIVQSILGSVSVVLLADAARRVTRPWVALSVGLALATYGMSVMFDGLVLAESLAFLIESLLIWTWCRRPLAPSSIAAFAWMGALIGLLAQVRGTAVLLLLPALWLARDAAAGVSRRAAARAAAAVGTVALFVLPSLAWNWHAAHEFIPLTYNFGYNLYVGNNPAADGGFVPLAGESRIAPAPAAHPDGGARGDGREFLRKTLGLDLSPAQSSAYWADQAVRFMRDQPARAAQLTVARLLMMWNVREIPQLENLELFRREAGPLGLPVVGSFLVFGILGLIGLAFIEPAPLVGTALRLYVAAVVLGVLPFFVVDRYRYHLIPALAILAALGIEVALRRWQAHGARGMRSVAAVAAAAAGLVLAVPLSGPARVREDWDLALDLGTRWLDQGRPELARREYERALAIEKRSGIAADPDPETRRDRARLDFNYASTLHSMGSADQSRHWIEQSVAEDPTNPRYVRALADADEIAGRGQEADSLRNGLRSLVGGDPEALVSAGWQAARASRRADAESLFRAAVVLDERQYGAWGALVRIQIERGKWASAESSLALAESAGLPRPALLAHRALLYAASGDTARARGALDELRPGELAGDHLLSGIAAAARRMLGRAESVERSGRDVRRSLEPRFSFPWDRCWPARPSAPRCVRERAAGARHPSARGCRCPAEVRSCGLRDPSAVGRKPRRRTRLPVRGGASGIHPG